MLLIHTAGAEGSVALAEGAAVVAEQPVLQHCYVDYHRPDLKLSC